MDRFNRIGLSIVMIGLAVFLSSLAFGDSLIATGVPCDKAPLANGTCTVVIATFWIGMALVVAGPAYIIIQNQRAIRKYNKEDPMSPTSSETMF